MELCYFYDILAHIVKRNCNYNVNPYIVKRNCIITMFCAHREAFDIYNIFTNIL